MGLRSFVSTIARGILVLAGLLLLAALFLFKTFDAPPAADARIVPQDANIIVEDDGSVLFVVSPGETASSVGKRLENASLIRSAFLWKLLARIDAESIKTGTYRLSGRLGTTAIRELFISGKQLLLKVTVPEGFTLKKIAALLNQHGITGASSFLSAAEDTALLRKYGIQGKNFEGFLYPDTYLFPRAYSAEQVVAVMADTFFQRVQKVAPKAISSYSPEELYRLVTLASIVEREYRVDDEAPLMAGVFLNRLRIGMALQSCATVEYIITEIQGKAHPEVLYNKDIAIADPYNTYIHRGLPPGPISSPGLVALDAVFNPVSSDYLYFRLESPTEGKHRFSRTLDEHIKAGVIYLKRAKAGS